jgi:uncharacterized protein
MSVSSEPRPANKLIHETSPYLLQHAHNPVDWHPWGSEALERAKREDKPILLSIGYAACHWCHVMEKESFENAAIARQMNDSFVCIKVDREERPDLDEIYMAATVAISGSGGWPMTVFLAPDQRPFFAGTYFPPSDKYGRPGFGSLLTKLASMWKDDREALLAQAGELTQHLLDQAEPSSPSSIDADAIARAARQLSASFDPRWGGFGGAPKFPPSASLSLLLRHHRRTGDPQALGMVTRTLDAMKDGGMYDHVAGGFARYSTDERWLVPHFEKMLYDNAQLARVYVEAYQVTQNPEYRRVASETLDYVVREMQAADGGYFSATDADSEGEEGKFFVWTPDEIAEVLAPDETERFCLYYDITHAGNWEGKSIVNTPRSAAEVARQLGIGESELLQSVEAAKQKVYEARKQRVPPLLDDKVLAAWNGLMIGAMAEGHRVLREPRWLASAERAARYLLEHLRRPDGGLYRTARAGRAHLDAYLEDYAYLSDALVDLYEAGGSSAFLREAERLAERMLADFDDSNGGAFYFTARGHEQLLVRTREGHDGAIPNPNAVAARALARLSFHFDREAWRHRAAHALEAYGRMVERSPRAFATSLSVLDFMLEAPVELTFAGHATDPATEALWAAVAPRFLPNRVIGHIDPAAPPRPEELPLPLVESKGLVGGKSALYVCRNYACQKPIVDAGEIASALAAGESELMRERASVLGGRKIEGSATREGTRIYAGRFATRHGPRGYALLGQSELTVSRIGFGGYRVDDGSPEQRAALEKALLEGSNLIDTSTNYADGHSERLIGEVIAGLVAQKRLSRAEVVVVSKIGYVQSKNLEIAQGREAQGKPFPEMVKYADGLWHCVHPEWLEDQLTRSLGRLGLSTLDVCLLHNPEYFFTDAVKRGEGPLAKLRDDFYQRVSRAFEHLEGEVRRGRLGCYGVSSNTAISSADARDATHLGRMLAAAREAGGDGHHFRVLELPMNLLEPGAVLEKNNGEPPDRTVLQAARENGIAVLVNRPLNAILEDGLVRLADPPDIAEGPPLQMQLARVGDLETEFRTRFAPMLRTESGGPAPASFFNWAEQLGKVPARAQNYADWHELEERAILPRIGQLVAALDSAFGAGEGEPWSQWRDRYLPELEKLLLAFRRRAADRSTARARAIGDAIDQGLPEFERKRPLSQKALLALLSTPGVTSVLVGMRRRAYVDDALSVMAAPAVGDAESVFRAARNARV